MLSQFFSHVENGIIIRSNILRGRVYNKKKYGTLSPDTTYIDYNLYPQYGEIPDYNQNTQVASNPIYTYAEEEQRVNVTWNITNIPQELTRRDNVREKKRIINQKVNALELQLKIISDTDIFIDNCNDATIKEIIKILVKNMYKEI